MPAGVNSPGALGGPPARRASVARRKRPLDTLLVITNLPDHASALELAQAIVAAKAGACVNVLSPCRSVYRWEGRIETAEEVPLLVKTTAARYPELEQLIKGRHPYELPEIIAVPLSAGLPAYLAWVAAETTP